ncbi:acyloxyacyl hydrolase [Frigidibacter sp. MR17.14]|uniref:acyloxyacyl hydrolase n=1 Tax=Frigidibacter sp. MR17.14 TaxID=3126509 RepID=UPI003012EC98
MAIRIAGLGAASLAVATVLAAGHAQAADVVIGLGALDYKNEEATVLSFELHSAPMWQLGAVQFGLGLGAFYSDEDSAFAGAGVTMMIPMGQSWFIEGSFMPGFYNDGGYSTDLGDELEFRTVLGVGYRIGQGAVSLAASHVSNADLADENPGVNGLSLRYRIGF